MAAFSIACTDSYKDKTTGEKRESTEWVNIVCWKGLADIAGRYLHKGDMVFLEGRLKTRTWEKDNVTRYLTEIVADNLIMLSSKPKPQPGTMESSGHLTAENKGNSSDDLPF